MWKKIAIDELDLYEVNEYGEVRNRHTMKKRKANIDKYGYLSIVLYTKKKKRKNYKVHRLVAATFISPEEYKSKIVNHKDGDRVNNHYSNLEWCTPKENSHHMVTVGKFNRENQDKYILAERICQYLEKNLSTSEIMKKENITGGKKNKKYRRIVKMIHAIKYRKSFAHIAIKYDVPYFIRTPYDNL